MFVCVVVLIIIVCFIISMLFFSVVSLSLVRGVIFVTSPKPLKFVMPKPLWTMVHDRTVLANS